MAVLIRLLVLCGIAYAVYRFLIPVSPITLTMSADGIMKSKGLSEVQRKRIVEFAQEQMLEGEIVKVKGLF